VTGVPHDAESERQLLGALLLRPDLMLQVEPVIKKKDLYLESHRLIYDAVSELYHQRNEDLDALQVIQFLADRSLIEQAGGSAYVLKLVEDVMAPGSALIQARRLRSISVRRDLMLLAEQIASDAAHPQEDEAEFLKGVEDKVLSITNANLSHGLLQAREFHDEFIEHIKHLAAARGGLTGTATHFTEFDQLTSGLKGGQLLILAARPSQGKTTLAMNIAANIALKEQKPVVVFSLEMSRIELMMRLVCAEARFSQSDLQRGHVGARMDYLVANIENLFRSPLYIDDSGVVDIWDCRARTRKLALELAQKGQSIGLIIVDYLQLMSDPQSRSQGRQHEVATISRNLKQLARMVDAPVIAVSQMNRSVEQRRGESARPMLSDLRESGAIEQDADIVMFIHHDKFDPDDSSPEALEKRGTAEIIIAKHRNGPTDSFRLAYSPQINRFDNRPGTE